MAENKMVVSTDKTFQHSIHNRLCGVEPIAVTETPLRRHTVDDDDLFASVLGMGANEADCIPKILSQIKTSTTERTALNITQIAYMQSSTGCAIDNEETHHCFHSEVMTEAL